MNYLTLNNGVEIPQLGFGVYQIPLAETAQAVYQGIKAGYRLIDTAIAYGNEVQTGRGIKQAIQDGLVTREELFVTTKLFIQDVGEERAAKAINQSLINLDLDYLDLYLIHQPFGDIYGAWRSLVAAQQAGKIRAIGVSNFDAAKLIEFVAMNGEAVPQVNQIELNPWHQREEDFIFHQQSGVQIQAWAPFAEGRDDLFINPVLKEIGQRHQKSVAQVILRWAMQLGVVVLAKSIKPERMKENLAIFDFELSLEEMAKIKQLNKQKSAFFDHRAPETVAMFMQRL